MLTECLSAALSGHSLHSLPAEMAKLLVVLLLLCALMLVAAQPGCPPIGPDTVGVCGAHSAIPTTTVMREHPDHLGDCVAPVLVERNSAYGCSNCYYWYEGGDPVIQRFCRASVISTLCCI